jgi:hypothetical protein
VLRIVMEEMEAGEVAALYEEGGDAIVLVNKKVPATVRCEAVNRMLDRMAVRVSSYRFPSAPPSAPRAGTVPDGPGSPTVLHLAN